MATTVDYRCGARFAEQDSAPPGSRFSITALVFTCPCIALNYGESSQSNLPAEPA